jgi:hypothetical protein
MGADNRGRLTHAVSNHGVDKTLVDQLFEQNRKFFALPEEEKRRMLVDSNSRRASFRPHAVLPLLMPFKDLAYSSLP